MICKIIMPEGAQYILNKLNEYGREAFIVGGCVRDSVMGRIPGDWDITTSATPEEVKKVFERTYDTGIQHGTVSVLYQGESYEVATYRIEGEYSDWRRPSGVSFTQKITEDLKRRDFTMNAVAFNHEEGFIDPFGGMKDIRERTIRCVGNAGERFSEDALRMLRALRFSAQLDFEIEKETMKAISKYGQRIEKVSKERIRQEMNKLLLSDHPNKILQLSQCGLMQYILPEFGICLNTQQQNPYHIYSVGMHSVKAVENIGKDLVLRWTMLLHDIGKPMTRTTDEKGIDHFFGHNLKGEELAERILKRLKFDNKTIGKVLRLIRWHDRPVEATGKAVRRAVKTVGDDIFNELLMVKEADIKSQNLIFSEDRLTKIETIRRIYSEVKRKGECTSKNELAINGNDLLAIGVKEGRKVGILLDELLDRVIDQPELNEREKLLAEVRKMV